MRQALAIAFAGFFVSVVQAQGIDAPPSAFAPNQGVVRAVDKAAGEIIIRHGPLTEIDMPPMTMAFEVKDASLLERVQAGDRVSFRVELLNGRFTVTQIQRLPEARRAPGERPLKR